MRNQECLTHKLNFDIENFMEDDIPCKTYLTNANKYSGKHWCLWWRCFGIIEMFCRWIFFTLSEPLMQLIASNFGVCSRSLSVQKMGMSGTTSVAPASNVQPQEKLAKINRTVVEHPLYSPDISPCDYHMIGTYTKTYTGWSTFLRWWLSGAVCAQLVEHTSTFFLWK